MAKSYKIIPVILAGGSGTRLWPLSREMYPKQLLNLVGEKTMLQQTLLRISKIEKISPPIIICNKNHRFIVAEQLKEIDLKPDSIILEPIGKNTAPALAIASLKKNIKTGEDALLLILPADHIIDDEIKFHHAVASGTYHANQGKHVAFGIIPDRAETGYSYIKGGNKPNDAKSSKVVEIAEFVEKPDKKKAEEYLKSGNYYWNSGMFIFKTSQVLADLKKFAPAIVDACEKALSSGYDDLDFFRLDENSFKACPNDSIDDALMGKTSRGVIVPLKTGWVGLGAWDAVWKIGSKDKNNNVFDGDVVTHDVKNSMLKAEKRLIAAVGLDNFVVVETADAVLISPRDRVQEVKAIVTKLKTEKRKEATLHKKVYRPWGSYEGIDLSNGFQVKRITVKPGDVLSLQKHYHRAEHWIVVKGTAMVTKGEETLLLKEDQSVYIPLGTTHRLENPGKIPLVLIEVQSGSYLGEDDVIRFEDIYGR